MKVNLKGWILFGQYEHEARWGEKPYFVFKGYEDLEGFVNVQEHSFTVEVPDDFDPRPQMVQKLEAEKRKVEAEFHARVTQINAQIQSLLAIEA